MGTWRYGVILDAGSSGTRVHIYRWLDEAKAKTEATTKQLGSLPVLKSKKKWTKKIRPGVSTWGPDPSNVGQEHLKELLDHALSIIPAKKVADTPIFLMATAGVRLLPDIQRELLLDEICHYTQEYTDFSLPDCGLHIQAIAGETEGLYGWIAANYLLGGFDNAVDHDHGKGHHTYGFLDMGGASAQIAFAPNATEAQKHANDLKLLRMRTLDGLTKEYKVFVATWLGFGVNEARHRYITALQDSTGSDTAIELPDPCLPKGLTTTLDGQVVDTSKAVASAKPYLQGLGRFAECLRQVYPLLDKDAPCLDPPCLLNGQHVPAIDFDVNHFVGVSEYWHTTHEIFEMDHKDKAYDFNTYQNRVNEFCSQDWTAIDEGVLAQKYGKKVDQKTAMEVCFKASWLINVLHDGIGIPRVGLEKTPSDSDFNGTKAVLDHAKDKGFLDPFQAIDKIEGTEVSWTLGKMVLYAAGQVKPVGDDLPVGFGSNSGLEVPKDFQYAGSKWSHTPDDDADDDDDDDDGDWDDTMDDVLKKVPRHSTTGLVALCLVLFLIAYLFRKPERRLKASNKFNAIFRRGRRSGSPRMRGSKGGFFGSKLFGRTSGTYERVLENGEAASEFELGDIDSSDDNDASDSSEGSKAARTSGMATPRLNMQNFGDSAFPEVITPSSPHFNGQPLNLNGLGIPNAMTRSGLMVRTESRERLATPGSLGRTKSRNGSPTRGKSPLMRPVPED